MDLLRSKTKRKINYSNIDFDKKTTNFTVLPSIKDVII